ncbi:MAG: VCBS repeat-containing protein, partial [Bacteroidota bacterium]|nr:VCBS repeat-containing protein [Bacteroidota bacterium]
MDGTLDLIVASLDESLILWYPDIRNNSQDQQLLFDTGGFSDLGVADLNGDLAPDLVIKGLDETHIHWNLGNGQFYNPTETVGTVPFDLDSDGDLDLLPRQVPFGGSLTISRNDGNSDFSQVLLSTVGFVNSNYNFVQVLDMDGDGLLDIIYKGQNGTAVWKNLGNFTFSQPIFLPLGAEYAEPLDHDLDGDLDLVTVTSGEARFFPNIDGDLIDAMGILIMDASICQTCRPDVIDENKDGFPDLLLHSYQASYLLLNDGQGNFEPAVPFNPGVVISSERKILDMDLDGDEDILFIDDVTFIAGSTLVWIENFALHPFSISGTIFADIDADGQFGGSELGIPTAALSVLSTGFTEFSGETGAFSLSSELGPQVISANLNNPFWTLSTGSSSISVELTENNPQIEGLLFGFTPIADTSVVQVTTEVASSTCNGFTTMWTSMANLGTRVELANLTLDLDDNWTFISSYPAPASNNNGVLTWDPESLGLFQSRSIALQLQVPDVDQLGAELIDQITVTSTDENGENEMNFTTTSSYINDCAYDPNDKQVEPAGFGIFEAIPLETEELTYTIRFQNTGTATATDVM